MYSKMSGEMIELLNENNIHAFSAFPNSEILRNTNAFATVSIKKTKISSAGFGNFLGESENGEEKGFLCDCLFSVGIFVELSRGAFGLGEVADKILQTVMFASGENSGEINFSQPEVDKKSAMMHMECEIPTKFFVVQTAQEQGNVLGDFIVKGMILHDFE